MRRALLILAICLSGAVYAQADEADGTYTVTKDGYRVKLEDGLTLETGGELLITRRDLQAGFGVDVRRLIPRSTPKKNRRRKQPRTWLLCYGDACARYQGRVSGAEGYEMFPISGIARAFRWKVEREGALVEITDRGTGKDKRGGKLGLRMPDITLPGLDGTPRRLGALRGKRVLIVLWSSWSTSREALPAWAAEWKLRKDKNLELWAVAVDLEGADRARTYVPPEIKDKVVLDRDGVFAGLLGGRELGRFALLDDLGLVRAVGEKADTVDLAWIDAHLAEPARAAADSERQPGPGPDVDALRAAVEKKPKRAETHAALAAALEPTDAEAARRHLRTAFELKPKASGIAMRLARMLLDAKNRPGAMNVLDEARRANPGAMWLRRQYWALDEPNRFYAGPIDTKWQSEQRRKEDKEWARYRRKRK